MGDGVAVAVAIGVAVAVAVGVGVAVGVIVAVGVGVAVAVGVAVGVADGVAVGVGVRVGVGVLGTGTDKALTPGVAVAEGVAVAVGRGVGVGVGSSRPKKHPPTTRASTIGRSSFPTLSATSSPYYVALGDARPATRACGSALVLLHLYLLGRVVPYQTAPE